MKPVLANSHFRKALSLSINRTEFANLCGSKPSVDFLTAGYIIDLESGKAYNDTNAHKSAVEQLINDTDGYGYSLEKARDYFRMALTELEHDGIYKPGTKDVPTEITLEIAWMFDSDEEDFHNLLKKYLETAFNDESVCKGVYKLNVNFWSGEEWSDVYYKKIMTGKYDLAYGSLSGNMTDPLSVLKTLSSNPDVSEGYTLSFGINTSDADVYPLVYNGHRWSFDALCTASLGAKG